MQSTLTIDLAALSGEKLNELAAAIDREKWQRAVAGPAIDPWADLLRDGTDEDIIAAAQAEYKNAPITLANRYARVRWDQETGFGLGHARRPVFMNGARQLLIRRRCNTPGGSSPNGWASDVLARAVRMSKATILDSEEYSSFIEPLIWKMHDRYRLTSAFNDLRYRVGGGWSCRTVLIGGRFVDLNASELSNVKALHAIIRKTNKLDHRKEMARQHMNERLAS
jgi:hypothetical protein